MPWPIVSGETEVGEITSAIWSPRLECNVGLAMIERGFWHAGEAVAIHSKDGAVRIDEIVELPFA